MLNKIKKVFFVSMFGVLYISFLAQLIYILGWVNGMDTKLTCLAALSIEWLVLIAARHLSKRSSTGATQRPSSFQRR